MHTHSLSESSGMCLTEVDGVSLLNLFHQGRPWRLGSINMGWRQELAGLPAEPGPEELAELAGRGVWLHRADQPPPLALVCCGQGSVYPGMGRELYDAFPPVREAMDRLAAKADWDLLGLMDETDKEKFVLTRWQQPYLLLLEYAQFHYLQCLGLRPSVFAGHSLGELIALCFAGAYTPEGAWHILDGRSKVMDELERSAQRNTGMMAVHAPQSAIDACLAEFPSLLVSNYNTPVQFILSGPKTDLQLASRALRKRRIPAIQINVNLAFHHPGMRVVREFSLNGLREVAMRGTRAPMLSNVTTGLYPDDAEGIREYILNLDENPVRWVECVAVMWRQFKVRHFLELGPSDTLCGLVTDNQPEALCLAAGRKGKEVEQMRGLVARLHALGHLPGACTAAASRNFMMHAPQSVRAPLQPLSSPSAVPPPSVPDAIPTHVEELMPILMEATGLARHELRQDMDLRHDLSLRSSRFPVIMHEVEMRFGLSLRFEDLLGVASVRDLADRIHALRGSVSANGARPSQGREDAGDSASQTQESITPDAVCHFSHFRDPWLRDAHPWPDAPHACLPPSLQLAAHIEGAAQSFPQLTPWSAEDLSFSVVVCPSGVTREGRVYCRDPREHTEQRSCRAELRLRDLMPNGRARQSWSPVCSARLLLLPNIPQTIAPVLTDPVYLSTSPDPAGQEDVRNLYMRHTGFGPGFRLLTELRDLGEKRLLARMRVPAEPGRAGLAASRYAYPWHAFEAAAQAAFLLALQRISGQNIFLRPSLLRVDAVAFSRACIPGETLGIELRNTADSERAMRHDAEVRDAQGRIVLALRGLCFDTE